MFVLEILFGAFALLGALDRLTGNHLKLGREFEKGILSVGPLALAMVGMISIAPVLSRLLSPLCVPLAELLQADPSFLGGFLANDMGGATVAMELAASPLWGGYHGLVVASMMGVTICFTVPVALETVDARYHDQVLRGILCGIATIPVGCVVSGLCMGFGLLSLVLNLLPVLLVSGLTCASLIIAPRLCARIFRIIGRLVLAVITVGLGVGVFTHITGIELIPYMAPVSEGFATVGGIAILLAGVFPLVAVLSWLFKRPFARIGGMIGINDAAVLGMVSSLANSIPTFSLVERMNTKGIVVNMAFAVSASFVFGDHLAFTMAFDEAFLPAMIVGKLTGGICAVVLACLLFRLGNQKKAEDASAVGDA